LRLSSKPDEATVETVLLVFVVVDVDVCRDSVDVDAGQPGLEVPARYATPRLPTTSVARMNPDVALFIVPRDLRGLVIFERSS
jgi:hypothetical protein